MTLHYQKLPDCPEPDSIANSDYRPPRIAGNVASRPRTRKEIVDRLTILGVRRAKLMMGAAKR